MNQNNDDLSPNSRCVKARIKKIGIDSDRKEIRTVMQCILKKIKDESQRVNIDPVFMVEGESGEMEDDNILQNFSGYIIELDEKIFNNTKFPESHKIYNKNLVDYLNKSGKHEYIPYKESITSGGYKKRVSKLKKIKKKFRSNKKTHKKRKYKKKDVKKRH